MRRLIFLPYLVLIKKVSTGCDNTNWILFWNVRKKDKSYKVFQPFRDKRIHWEFILQKLTHVKLEGAPSVRNKIKDGSMIDWSYLLYILNGTICSLYSGRYDRKLLYNLSWALFFLSSYIALIIWNTIEERLRGYLNVISVNIKHFCFENIVNAAALFSL